MRSPRGPWVRLAALAAVLSVAVVGLPAGAGSGSGAGTPVADREDWAAYVDPMVGTFAPGFVFPGAATPFGMVQNSPDTEGDTSPFAYTGYLYSDPTIRGFSLVHQSGPGVHMGGNLPFLPVTAPVLSTHPTSYAVPFTHAAESASPGAYGVTLGNGVDVDLGVTQRAALQRYAFPAGAPATVIAAVGRSNTGNHPATVAVVGPDRLEGSVTEAGNRGGPFTVHFSAQFSEPFTATSTYVGDAVTAGSRAATGTGAGALLSFAPGSTVTLRVGISYVDVDGARRNLAAELPSYDVEGVQRQARDAWNDELDRVRVAGGTLLDRRSFYTSLYRSFLHPNVFSDVDGRYRGTDGAVHTVSGRRAYENFSLWDTIRTQNQLLATLQPARYRDMVASLWDQAKQSGEWPRWSLHSTKPNFMNGDPAVATVVDGYCRGVLRGLDADGLYSDLRRLAFDQRRADYLSLGYVPIENAGSSGADTLEYGHADFSLALMAERLGHDADAATLVGRSRAWERLFNPATRFLQPRHADGSFDADFDPSSDEGWREGNGWQYLWLAPHDVGSLADRIGGDAATVERLDSYFSTLVDVVPGAVPAVQNATNAFGTQYRGTQHNPGNEHDLQAPYYYDYVGQPWKTQQVMRSIQSLFAPTPNGLPGNDDLGSLTSWYVFSALGFGPVTLGAPVNVIGSPRFPAVSLRLTGPYGNGWFTIEAPGASVAGKYVQTAALNGRPLDRTWFADEAIRPGGVLRLEMGLLPNESWGSGADAAPPSAADGLGAFRCNPPGLASRK